MFMVLRRYYATRPGAAAEMLTRVRELFVPVVSQVPGFVEYFAVDAGQGQLLFVTVCRDRAGAEASIREAAAFVKREKLTLIINGGPEIIEGEVAFHQAARTD
ncbi:MAG TPA: antibiotic biosynthesis monooxygenase [Polyangia bacterium]|jgi:hypothetical protein